jgi:hypothetical protein
VRCAITFTFYVWTLRLDELLGLGLADARQLECHRDQRESGLGRPLLDDWTVSTFSSLTGSGSCAAEHTPTGPGGKDFSAGVDYAR